MDDSMHICFACDEAYQMHTMSVMLQIMEHDDDVKFHVLMPVGSSDSAMHSFAERVDVKLDVSFIGHDGFTAKRKHLSDMTFARLYIPNLFPMLKKVMYLDSDILVMQSLRGMWGEFDCKQPLGMVVDAPCIYSHRTPLSYNAGVLMMDVRKLLKLDLFGFAKWLYEYMSLEQEDQTILNVFGKAVGIQELPMKYNNQRMATYISGEPLDDDVAIKHFVYDCKPWNYGPHELADTSLMDKYMDYEHQAERIIGL